MNKKQILHQVSVMLLIASLLLGGCQPSSTPNSSLVSDGQNTTGLTTLRIAVIPVLDALPMYVAQKEGIFKTHGINVEFIPVASGAERDQMIISAQADGMVNEVLSTLLFNKEKVQVQVVRYARAATSTSPLFRIMVSKESGIKDPDGLKGAEIGISDGTIIAYLTDRLLEKKGFNAEEIKTISVPKISDRLALLSSGQLKAAVLPDPTSSLAVQQGSIVLVDDTLAPELSFSTISFRKQMIVEHPEAIRGFLAAVEEATEKINSDSSQTLWLPVLAEQKLIPVSILKGYKIPKFVTKGVPTESQFLDVLEWAKGKGLIKTDVGYEDSINSSFLP